MNQAELQQLKNKVISKQVKGLTVGQLRAIEHQPYPTQMERATMWLLDNGHFTWPLSQAEHDIVVGQETIGKIPRYLKIIIENNINIPQVNNTHQSVWLYRNGYSSIPQCNTCDAPTRWSTKQGRFTLHCSNKCRATDPDVNEKRNQTCIAKYGHDKLLSDSNHAKQTRQSCVENNGVSYPLKSKKLYDKAQQGKIDKYGSQYKAVISAKSIAALNKKYNQTGEDQTFGQVLATTQFLSKKSSSRIQNWLPGKLQRMSDTVEALYDASQYTSVHVVLPYRCVSCHTEFSDTMADGKLPRCPTCYPLRGVNFMEKQVFDFIEPHVDNIVANSRSIINPKELDILLPNHNLAIEYNGLYWHSDVGSQDRIGSSYHLDKTTRCAEQGIRLMHIFEDEWVEKQPIVKSIILQAIHKVQHRIYGRKCSVVELTNNQTKRFLDDNHIQGYVASTVCYGLKHNDNVVAVMSFGKSRFASKSQWELLRYCSAINTSVVGGAQRLFKQFINNHSPQSITSYCDNRLFTGNIYDTLGFDYSHTTKPGYWYVDINGAAGARLNRMQFQKHKLSSKLNTFDPSLTERDNMRNNGFGRIYDVGQSVYTWVR